MCRQYGGNNSADLKSEVILLILEMPADKLKHIIDENYLLPYSLQILRLQTRGHKWSTFKKKYLNEKEQLVEDITIFESEPESDFETLKNEIETIECKIKRGERIYKRIIDDAANQNSGHFYHARLVIEKMKHKSTKSLSRATNIPYLSMRYALKEYRDFLTNEYK